MTVEYSVFPSGRNEWSSAFGVIIDGFVYTLAGEPPRAQGSVGWFTGNGQR